MHTAQSLPVSDLGSVATILLAGGKGTRLYELTSRQAKPAVYFAGPHRLVDFTMANTVRSGLRRLLVATQFAPDTLRSYIPTRWGRHFNQGELLIRDGRDTYRGTADAVRRNWQTIVDWDSDEVLVLAADHVYDMDYGALISAHRASGAEVTVAVDVVPRPEATGFGVMHANHDGVITSFLEKPADPPEIIGEPGFSMASMGIYVFSRSWLQAALSEDDQAIDFGHNIIPKAVDQGVATAYRLPPCPATGRTYWRDVGTLDALRLAQLDFAESEPCRLPGDGASIQWRVGRDSVLMPGAVASRCVRLSRTIVAPGTHLPLGLVVGEDPLEDRRWFRRTDNGTVLVTQSMIDRRAQVRSSPTVVALRSVSRSALAPRNLNPALDKSNA